MPEFWAKTEERLLADLAAGQRLRTPVSLIYHSLADVNDKLRLGRYFFIDIVGDGIVLFEEAGFPLAEPMALSPAEALRETREYYEEWFESAAGFLRNAGYAVHDADYKLAAFLLHQATERFYHPLDRARRTLLPLRDLRDPVRERVRRPSSSRAEGRDANAPARPRSAAA